MMYKMHFLIGTVFFSFQALGQGTVTPGTNRDSNMVKQLFFAGLREKMSENYVVAATNFNKIIGLDPNNHAAYFELANADLRLDKLLEAEQHIKQAIKINAGNLWYWRLLGEVYKRSNKMPELIGVFNQLIRLDPENDAYYFDKANAQFLANQPDAAKKTYVEIQGKFGDSRDLVNARKRLQANGSATTESDIVKLLEGNQADVKNYLYAAGLLLQKGNDQEALKVLTKAQQLEPDNFEVNLALADIYRSQKNDEAAFSSLKLAFQSNEMPLVEKVKIIAALFPKMNQPVVAKNVTGLSKLVAEKNPTEAKALALYGDVLYQQNNLKEALIQYQAALKLNEQVYIVWEQVINIQTLLGHYDEAIKVGDEALTIYPNQASLYYYMAYALFKTGKYESAQNNLKTSLQLDVDNKSLQAQVYALQGDVYISQNNFGQAKTAFEKAIVLEPDNYLIMNNYAYYLALRNDDLTKAAKYAETAALAMPNNPSVADTYAFILFKQQKYDLAKTWIEKALQNNSNKNGVYLERYGDILFLKGEKDAALMQWQKAKETGNGSEVLIKKINEKKYFK
ncbi:Flp pilus assembly protein TadD, contains TPR repeats [Pedobacter terrae]|uniref:Flp pilus assembly protein TadD, contains TPR repeats n=1 Tax=Pedobacter terrae TaxID=405671 RepID=A0A1G7S385_9SPHI|nr:tetratricopeptide repeat protein [Pedobacter terrae]SDG17525.1 Flp pilus assembly protein TadD, contains TPR repeats [Pedobacter terrae]